MSSEVFAAVLLSACFQAGWNFVTKRSRSDKIALLAVGWFFLGCALMPLCLVTWPTEGLSDRAWVFILTSGFVQAFYLCFLGWAYALADISIVYPVARGLGVVGTAVGALVLGLAPLSGFGMLGVAGVVLGSLLVGWRRWPKGDHRKALIVILLLALTIAVYSLLDSQGAREVPLLIYLTAMNLLAPLLAAPFLMARKGRDMLAVLRGHRLEALAVALGGAISYSIVLWAYQRSDAPLVAALRESSVLLATGLGVILLRESLDRRKAVGIAFIVIGIISLRLA